MAERKSISGRCLCGAVGVSAAISTREIGACHCSMCRKWTGGPLLAIHCDGEVSFTGNEHIAIYGSSDWAERGFCNRCGTHLFYRLKREGEYALPAGFLDEGPEWILAEQIFIDEKPAYYDFANATRNMTGPEVFAAYGKPEA
jgi:hypothetical protein